MLLHLRTFISLKSLLVHVAPAWCCYTYCGGALHAASCRLRCVQILQLLRGKLEAPPPRSRAPQGPGTACAPAATARPPTGSLLADTPPATIATQRFKDKWTTHRNGNLAQSGQHPCRSEQVFKNHIECAVLWWCRGRTLTFTMRRAMQRSRDAGSCGATSSSSRQKGKDPAHQQCNSYDRLWQSSETLTSFALKLNDWQLLKMRWTIVRTHRRAACIAARQRPTHRHPCHHSMWGSAAALAPAARTKLYDIQHQDS